ncbi:MAG TPA: ABC-F family ATP-binding cassette domain-containing protein [Gemmatimonadaceae bacterium]|nr:ABC-F family ATP-binding cassette domain-containing protein [Gemmatimonadaceae bacterium]
MTQLSVSGVGMEFGASVILRDVTFTVAAGERWGIVGRNGTGKSTLFRLITGELNPTQGSIARTPGLRITLLEQHRDFGGASTVWEAVSLAFASLIELETSLAEQAHAIGEVGHEVTPAHLDRYAHDLERFEHEGGYTFHARVDAVLHGLGFDPDAARTTRLETLSGGERGRIGLARQLVTPADMLLLDEPTNHLDLETTRWLEEYLASVPASVLLVSHDRAFLAAVADHVLHFEHKSAVAYTGGYEAFVLQRAERRLSQQRAFERQQRVVAGEEDYIRRNIAGQNTKQAKGRRKRLERLPRLSPPPGSDGVMALRFDSRERGGDQVIVADGARVAIGSRPLIAPFSAQVRRGDRVGLIGPNGAGKSTMLRVLLGERPPAEGALRLGLSTTVAYYRQDLAQVPLDRTIYDAIADRRPMWERRSVQSHLGRFGFSGDEVQRVASGLSGGERARLALAMMMLEGANLLVLDEPTNHLDVESIEALEDAIEEWGGTVLMVSHDRALLRALATRVWEVRDGQLEVFDGPFAEWEVADAERRERADADRSAALKRERDRSKESRRDAPERGRQDAARTARREVESAEAEVMALEERITALTEQLAEPALYEGPGGVGAHEAARLGSELEAARRALDGAVARWSDASERVHALQSAD